MRKNKANILFLIILALSCVEPYDYEALKTEKVLVVDAVLTNEQKAHTVTLSYSYPIDTFYLAYVPGAEVWIESGSGANITLTETSPGTYSTPDDFFGTPNESYQLRIRTANQHEYTSTIEKMVESPPIDSVYGEFVTIPSEETSEFLNGVQFFIDTDLSGYEADQFRYTWEETYEVRVPYPSFFIWSEDEKEMIVREESVAICFKDKVSKSLVLGSSTAQTVKRIQQFPVQFIDEKLFDLKFKCALRIKQYALSSSTYRYYKRLKENNENSGSLFDKQKGPIIGNIKSITDEDEIVLGNFEVSGVTEVLDFFKGEDFVDQGFRLPLFQGCDYTIHVDSIPPSQLEEYFSSFEGNGRGIWTLTGPPSSFVLTFPEYCTDCRFHGSIERPDFWE